MQGNAPYYLEPVEEFFDALDRARERGGNGESTVGLPQVYKAEPVPHILVLAPPDGPPPVKTETTHTG